MASIANQLGAASRTGSTMLRRVLLADAVVSGAAGVALVLGADPLDDRFGLSSTLLLWAGLSLFPFAALMAYLGTREHIARWAGRSLGPTCCGRSTAFCCA